MIYDDRQCSLGEGPLWHPLREQLFWFDINNHQLLTKDKSWQFDEYVSAAGWVDHDTLLIASETQLFTFNVETGEQEYMAPLESDNDVTRSNDGRADPQGGFWIGTMGKNAEPRAGAIYRYFEGSVRKLFGNITISNSICFAPSGDRAYYCDTIAKVIKTVALDEDGWPIGKPSVAADLTATGENPDGSVVDADGNIWNAQWGASRVACYGADGEFKTAVQVAAKQVTCPAFAGASGRMFVTSATEGLDPSALADAPDNGKTFEVTVDAIGQKEHQVIL
ncbi:MAG: SMP-30/gluconolactonase/LRE family protein [Planktomarina sp.]